MSIKGVTGFFKENRGCGGETLKNFFFDIFSPYP